MTTIAANRSMIAADSQNSDQTGLMDTCKKLHRTPGGIVGFSGSEQTMGIFLDWANAGFDSSDKPEIDEDSIEVLLLNEDGLWLYLSKLVRIPIQRNFWSVGGGGNIAMGAMAMGATPDRAIEIASEYNVDTGGPVCWSKLEAGEPERMR